MKKHSEQIISIYIRKHLKGIHFDGAVELAFRWYEPNKKRDLDNICFAKKIILDALVSNEIIVADGWKGVVGFTDKFFVDKENPRIEVDIKKAGGIDEYVNGIKNNNSPCERNPSDISGHKKQ